MVGTLWTGNAFGGAAIISRPVSDMSALQKKKATSKANRATAGRPLIRRFGMSLVVATVQHHQEQKKAGVAEHPEVFDHVGLLVNGPYASNLPQVVVPLAPCS